MHLTLEKAKELNKDQVTEESLIIHSLNVCYAMGGMAKHFGEDEDHWMAVGYLHDYDYEKYPEEHLQHTQQPLLDAGVSEEDVHAIMSHGYSILNDVKPVTNMEKSLFTVDELTGIIQACARMRPNGITDSGNVSSLRSGTKRRGHEKFTFGEARSFSVKSLMKKFKDKRFAAKCDRDMIRKGPNASSGRMSWEDRSGAET